MSELIGRVETIERFTGLRQQIDAAVVLRRFAQHEKAVDGDAGHEPHLYPTLLARPLAGATDMRLPSLVPPRYNAAPSGVWYISCYGRAATNRCMNAFIDC